MKNTFYLIIILSILLGCSTFETVENTCNVDLDEACNDTDIINRYIVFDNFIPVQSKDIFITLADKIVPHKSNVYIFDKHQPKIFVYNMQSKKLSIALDRHGHAKEEYINICDFAIDNKGNILVYDNDMGKINWYNSHGKFIKSMPVALGGKSIALAKDGRIAIDCSQLVTGTSVIIYLPNGSVSTKIKQPQLYNKFVVGNDNSITWNNGNVIFTRPYDYTIYSGINEDTLSLFQFDFGNKNFSFNKFDGISYEEFQNQLMASAGKQVMWLSNLSVYKNLYFFTTDNMNSVLLDTSRDNKTYILSNMKSPYGVLFCSPLFVNDSREIYTFVRCDNVDNALRPTVKFYKEQSKPLPEFLTKPLEKQYDNVSFWLLKAHVK